MDIYVATINSTTPEPTIDDALQYLKDIYLKAVKDAEENNYSLDDRRFIITYDFI